MPSRRDFLLTGVTGAAAVVARPALLLGGRARYDVVVRGGHVVDGSGRAGVEADVAITDARVVAVGRNLRDTGRFELDARGFVVAPGFVDIHSHGDGSLWDDPRAESVVRQGITTIVVGQDGGSLAPSAGGRRGLSSFAAL